MSTDSPYSHRRIVWFSLCVLILFPLSTGCYSNEADRPTGLMNVEFLHLLRLGTDDMEVAGPKERVSMVSTHLSSPESLAFVNETTLAIGTEYEGVYFVDVSNPAEPATLSAFEHENHSVKYVVAMDGFVYGFSRENSLLAIDVRQPAEPKLAGIIEGQEDDRLLAVGGGHLFVYMGGGIEILNAVDPFALSVEGVYYPPQTRAHLPSIARTPAEAPTTRQLEAEKAQGIFIAHDEFSLETLPCSHEFIRNADILGAAYDAELLYVWVDGVSCEGPDERTVGHVTVSEGGRKSEPTPMTKPVVREVESGGLWVLDVSVPSEPIAIGFLALQDMREQLSRYPSFVDVYHVTVGGDYLYLVPRRDLDGRTATVDVSDPGKPVLVEKSLNADVAAWEDYRLYVAEVFALSSMVNPTAYNYSLQVFDVSDVQAPVHIGMVGDSPVTERAFSGLNDIAVRGGIIYIAAEQRENIHGGGLYVFRLIDPDWRPESAPLEESDN